MPAATWTTRYEDLRRGAQETSRVLEGSWGLALFLRQGLRAWMQAWPRPSNLAPALPPSFLSRPAAPPARSASLSEELLTVLTNMVFSARQEVGV